MDQVLKLRARIEELEEELRQYKAALRVDDVLLPTNWRLTKSEATVLKLLLKQTPVPFEHMHMALWGDDPNGGPEEPSNVVSAYLWKIGKKIPGASSGFRRQGGYYHINERLRKDLQVEVETSIPSLWLGPSTRFCGQEVEKAEGSH